MAETIAAERMMRANETGRSSLREWPGWYYVPGVAFVVIGIVAIAEPPLASIAATFYVGAMLLVGGAFMFLGGVVNLKHRGSWIAAVIGLLSFITGLIVIEAPRASATMLVWVMGAWLIAGGLLELAIGFKLSIGRGWLILVSIVNIALGVFMVTMQPGVAFAFLGYVVGISMVVQGLWSLLFTADLNAALRDANFRPGLSH
jgi:uncharacterized membrane protein HdeD (DUF308 family)